MKKILHHLALLAALAIAIPSHATEPLALVNDATGKVQTFIRPDLPAGWTAPAGYHTTARSALPEGYTMEPAPAAPVPDEVGAGQIRAAMIASGIAADDAALDILITGALTGSIADTQQRAIALALWAHASTFKRGNTFVLAAQAALGKTDTQMDDLFRLAATF